MSSPKMGNLIITRHKNQSVLIHLDAETTVELSVIAHSPEKVTLAFYAPKDILINRSELEETP